jgi:ATP-dependent DNA helicase DinG
MGASAAPDALTPELREAIQRAYKMLRERQSGFQARASQRRMIAEVARALSQPHGILVAEAPTGTGKSMAYLLAALPVARAQNKKLVIATATVALQEQLVERDIPALLHSSGLAAEIVLAKGRQRYVCTRNLHELLADDSELPQGGFEFGEETPSGRWPRPPRAGEVGALKSLKQTLLDHTWNGDLDRAPMALDDQHRALVTTTAGGCSNRRCPYLQACPFILARNRLQNADVIVANHDLVLADLSLGQDEDGSGGVLLPAPSETLYVFDEAHHLPLKAIDRGAAEVHLADARRRLARWAAPMRAAYLLSERERVGRLRAEELDQCLDELQNLLDNLDAQLNHAWQAQAGEDTAQWRASHGQIPESWSQLAQSLAQHTNTLLRWLPSAMKAVLESDAASDRREAQARELGLARERLSAQSELWSLWAQADAPDYAPTARWLSRASDGALRLHASAVSAAPFLRRMLWAQAAGVVLTSATLSLGGDFRNYAAQIGLPESAVTLALPSPFDLERQASLEVPQISAAPEQVPQHVAEIATWLDASLDWNRGNLVLFTSRAKLQSTLEALPAARRLKVLAQGSRSKHALLEAHAEAIGRNLGSTLFGLASFGEGLDLPGRLCETVVITQLPFAVPTDPVGATYAEWLETQGRNAFVEVSIPQATRTLIQYCGRLIRSETDSGRVVILDTRLLTRRYGARMLAALPAFRRVLPGTSATRLN